MKHTEKTSFLPGELIEGLNQMAGVKGRIIAAIGDHYKILWVGAQYREQDQFQNHSKTVIETFYRKSVQS